MVYLRVSKMNIDHNTFCSYDVHQNLISAFLIYFLCSCNISRCVVTLQGTIYLYCSINVLYTTISFGVYVYDIGNTVQLLCI